MNTVTEGEQTLWWRFDDESMTRFVNFTVSAIYTLTYILLFYCKCLQKFCKNRHFTRVCDVKGIYHTRLHEKEIYLSV